MHAADVRASQEYITWWYIPASQARPIVDSCLWSLARILRTKEKLLLSFSANCLEIFLRRFSVVDRVARWHSARTWRRKDQELGLREGDRHDTHLKRGDLYPAVPIISSDTQSETWWSWDFSRIKSWHIVLQYYKHRSSWMIPSLVGGLCNFNSKNRLTTQVTGNCATQGVKDENSFWNPRSSSH